MEIYTNIENAGVAALKNFVDGDPAQLASYWPKSLKNSAGQLRIFGGESDQIKDGQAILFICEDANQEDPQFTGNFQIPVQVWLRTPPKVLTADEIAKKAFTAKQNHDAAAAILSDFFNQDPFTIAAILNTAGGNFTIMGGIMDLRPMRSEMENFFASGWSFRIYAMNQVAP